MKNFQETQSKTEADILLFLLPHTETQEKTKGIFLQALRREEESGLTTGRTEVKSCLDSVVSEQVKDLSPVSGMSFNCF